MRAVFGVALAGLLATAAAGAAAQDKDKEKDKGDKIDIKKLLGKWELTGEEPKGAKVTVEFTKENKVLVEVDENGKKDKTEATYKLDGNKITLTHKGPDGKEDTDTGTITKLTDDELVMLEEGKKKPDVLKRVKEKDKK